MSRTRSVFAAICLPALVVPLCPTAARAQCGGPFKLMASDGAASDFFGYSVAVSGDIAVVGAYGDGSSRGTAYVYRWDGAGWTQMAKLTAADGTASDRFGRSVAISGDTIVVGAYYDDVGASANQGSAYVFVRPPGGWANMTHTARLTASDGAASDYFGCSVAISGGTVVVGAYGDDDAGSASGSAYVFVRPPGGWSKTSAWSAKLTASDGAASDYFGYAVAVGPGTIVVGAYFDDVGANSNQGSAYVFTEPAGGWATTSAYAAKLTASDGAASDFLGCAVAVSDDTVVVGAYGDDDSGDSSGSAYVFVSPPGGWADMSQTARLTPSDASNLDWFGYSVAIWGETVAVSAYHKNVGASAGQGAAYVFDKPAGGWATTSIQAAKLIALDGAAYDYFGSSIAMWGDTLITGADGDDSARGSAHVFHRTGASWVQSERTILASDGATSDFFGHPVAISGDIAVVGAYGNDDFGSQSGSAYVYRWDGSAWAQLAKLTASDGAVSDYFGNYVAISGDTIVAAAPGDDVGANADQGSVYVFIRPPGGWATTSTYTAKLTASDGAAGDWFGGSIAISDDTIIIGAYLDDDVGSASGSAYVFVRPGAGWATTSAFGAKLTASDGAANDGFGNSVAISGDTVVVGANMDDDNGSGSGSAYVFVRPDGGWATTSAYAAKLTASDGAANDSFGRSVAISGDSIVIGAYGDDIGANASQGSAYVFVRPAGGWTTTAAYTAKLTASDGAAGDYFGYSVAAWGERIVAGAYGTDGSGSESGSAYVFARPPAGWATTSTYAARLTASDGAADDRLGYSVAVSGDAVLAGAYGDDVGAVFARGSARSFYVGDECLAFARNMNSGTRYTTITSAISAAASGQGILATSGAFTIGGHIDFRGKSLLIESTRGVMMPDSSDITLANGSVLASAEGYPMTLFGQLRVLSNGAADVYADELRIGSAGLVNARFGSGLYLNVPVTRADGTIRAETNSTLSFTGLVTGNGPVEALSGSTLIADAGLILTGPATFLSTSVFAGPVWVDGTLNCSDSSVSAPLLTIGPGGQFTGAGNLYASLTNNNRVYAVGDMLVVGNLMNNAGALIAVQAGTTSLLGSLTNYGTIVGQFSAGATAAPQGQLQTDAPEPGDGLLIQGDYIAGIGSSLTLSGSVWRLSLAGNYDVAVNNNARYDMSQAELRMTGGGGVQTLELMSRDIGSDPLGFDRTLPGHYPLGTLHLASPATVQLVDRHDNDSLGQASCEALYVLTLVIDAGATLNTGACRVYCTTLISNGTVDNSNNIVRICATAIPADFDRDCDVDLDDLDMLRACRSGPTVPQTDPACTAPDLDADGDVDHADFGILQACYSGAGRPADAACAR